MNVAVLSLTRDRLAYTQHCFASLYENAGCPFDHFILDQGSTDGTVEWLLKESKAVGHFLAYENLGISKGHNKLLEQAFEFAHYDVVVTFDNDCEVTQPGTLEVAARICQEGWVISPTVLGLKQPPKAGEPVLVGGELVAPYPELGGIFRAMPGSFARGFRFREDNPLWGWDERDVGREAAAQGLGSGYLVNWQVNHFETTAGQEARYPAYFERKYQEIFG